MTSKYGLADQTVEEHFLNFRWDIPQSTINYKRYINPWAPFYRNDTYLMENFQHCDKFCTDGPCKCTHLLPVDLDDTIQLVFANLITFGPRQTFNHPIHLHGHSFAVLHVGFPPDLHTNSPDIECVDAMCSEMRWANGVPEFNLIDPPIKDTVMVPSHGYAVVRFKADNPGFWMLHCHQEQHMEDGMMMILQVRP